MPEPLAASSPRPSPAEEPPPYADLSPEELEVARLEGLLSARSRDLNALRREFSRRDRLLREALERMATSSSDELAALRRGYEAAVDRAVEAEFARAELTFTLDETRAQLGAAPGSGQVSAAGHAGPAPLVHAQAVDNVSDARAMRGLYARIAELEETEGTLHARLVLAEQDRDLARDRVRELEREALEDSERAELSLVRERSHEAAYTMRAAALAGELSGLRARSLESERALRSAQDRAVLAEKRATELNQKLADARSESAELAVLAHGRAARLIEQSQELALEQQEARALRAQLEAALAAHTAERGARDADAERWVARSAEFEADQQRDRAALATAQRQLESAPLEWRAQLQSFLDGVKQPLSALAASLERLNQSDRGRGRLADGIKSEGEASMFDGATMANLVEQLRVSQGRVAQLEAAVAQQNSRANAALKGELIDTRVDAARLADDLSRERTRRRKLAVTVRALQAASESGEAIAPWIDELMRILNEGVSIPPSV